MNGSVPNSGNLTVNSGMLAPGGDNLYGTLNIGNNLIFGVGGAPLDEEVDSVSNTDFIAVTGSATLGGTMSVEAAVGNFLEGQTIPILTATGGVIGTFDAEIIPLVNGNPLFEVKYNTNSVELLVLDTTIFNNQPGEDPQVINSGNPQKVTDYIEAQLPIDPNSDFGFVVRSLGLLSNKEVNKALNLMHPGSFGLFQFISLTNSAQVMQMVNGRLFGTPSSASSTISQLEPSLTAATEDRPFYPNTPIRRGCERGGNHSVWLQPFGTWNSQSQKGELRGANYESTGALIGYDYTFSQFYVGGNIGYTYTNFRWKGTTGNGHVNQVYGGVYGSYFQKYFAATLATMVGGNYYHTHRFIEYDSPGHPNSALNRTAKSRSTGIQWTNHLGLIGDFSSLSVPLQIFANLDHFYLHNGSFGETGADSINLRVNTKVSNALRSELGLSSSYTFHMGSGCCTPYIRLSWVNKTLLSNSSYRGGFRGQVGTFSVSPTSKGTNQFSPGLGIMFANQNGFSLLLNSRAELNGKMKNYSADMRMEFSF